jgi:hypothetical protein
MKNLLYKEIEFDDYVINPDGAGGWVEICEDCAQKHRDKLNREMKPGGCPGVTCFVKGCLNNDDDQPHYYIDFKAESITFV